MAAMRLGTRVAVINADDEILLSKRGDFGVWALPGGRLDRGELLADAAIREVREETGLDIAIERPIGLYFQQGRARMNVLYRAHPIGGQLIAASDETLDNRFFKRDALPDDRYGQFYMDDAYHRVGVLHTEYNSWWALLQIDLRLRWRWLQNWLAKRPEPRFPHFRVRAIGIVRHGNLVRVGRQQQLPQIVSDGRKALDTALSDTLGQTYQWHWLGVRQDLDTDTLDFILHSIGSLGHGNFVPMSEVNVADRVYLDMDSGAYDVT